MITICVPCIPVAQPRQRHALIAGHVRNYTPAKDPVNAFKATLRLAAQQVYHGPPLSGPLRVIIDAVFPRLSNTPKKRPGRLRKTTKPDLDNVAKAVMDALNGLTWADDAAISELTVTKWHAAADEQPNVEILIEERPK